MSAISSPAEKRVYLEDISWKTYMSIVSSGDQQGRITYDRGILEIMSPSKIHEQIRWLIGRMIEAFAEESDIDLCIVGSTTFCREDLNRGIEADECYYINHTDLIRSKEEIDLSTDPAPDLAVEIDISRTSTGKLDIYAAIGVAEVWRYCEGALHIHVLNQAGVYEESDGSVALPRFPIGEMVTSVANYGTIRESQIVRRFRASLSAEPRS